MVTEVIQGVIMLLLLGVLLIQARQLDRLEEVLEETQVQVLGAGAEQTRYAIEIVETLKGEADRILTQTGGIGEKTERILTQMDDIASAASLNDLVADGMNNLMRYDGSPRKEGD